MRVALLAPVADMNLRGWSLLRQFWYLSALGRKPLPHKY